MNFTISSEIEEMAQLLGYSEPNNDRHYAIRATVFIDGYSAYDEYSGWLTLDEAKRKQNAFVKLVLRDAVAACRHSECPTCKGTGELGTGERLLSRDWIDAPEFGVTVCDGCGGVGDMDSYLRLKGLE